MFTHSLNEKNRSSAKESRNVSQDGYKSPKSIRPHNRITDIKGNTSPLKGKSYYTTDYKRSNGVSKGSRGANKPDQHDGQSSVKNTRLISTINSQLNISPSSKRQQFSVSKDARKQVSIYCRNKPMELI